MSEPAQAQLRAWWPIIVVVAAALISWGIVQSSLATARERLDKQDARMDTIARDYIGVEKALSALQAEIQGLRRDLERPTRN